MLCKRKMAIFSNSNNPKPTHLFSGRYLFISIALSLASMAVVIYMTYEPGTDFSLLKPKRWPGLFLALIISFLRIYAAAARVHYLSDKAFGWLASFRIILAWDFASSVTPSTIGGAPLATYAMTKERVTLGQSSAIVLYTVLLDQILYAIVLPLLFLSSFYYQIIPGQVGFIGTTALITCDIGFLVYAALLTYSVLLNPDVLRKIITYISNFWFLGKYKNGMLSNIDDLVMHSRKLKEKPLGFSVKAFLLTTGVWLARNILPTVVILSLLPAPEILSFLRSIAMNFAFFAMPTPGGSGGVEGLFLIFQGPLIEREVFIGIALFVWRFVSYYITIGLGISAAYWYINKTVNDKRVVERHSNQETTHEPENI